jgi:hypothetical protein
MLLYLQIYSIEPMTWLLERLWGSNQFTSCGDAAKSGLPSGIKSGLRAAPLVFGSPQATANLSLPNRRAKAFASFDLKKQNTTKSIIAAQGEPTGHRQRKNITCLFTGSHTFSAGRSACTWSNCWRGNEGLRPRYAG